MSLPLTLKENPFGFETQVLAALEEREALLGEREDNADRIQVLEREVAEWKELQGLTSSRADLLKADASVGALVRRIGELQPSAYLTWAGHPMCYYVKHPSVLQSALDSLLPKEPEVVTGESGRQYRRTGGKAIEARHICADGSPTYWATVGGVPVIDAPVVAKLMESAKEVGK